MMAALQRFATIVLLFGFLAPVDALDHRLESAIQSGRRAGLERPMRTISDVCNPVTLSAGLLAVALLGGPAGIETARTALIALIPTNLVVEGLKRLTDRTRPDGEHRPSNASFPSSHVANAFALALVFARRWRRAAIPLLLAAALVGWSRMYLNRHFPSDVLGGAVVGVFSAWLVLRGLKRRRAAAAAETAQRAALASRPPL
jgi:membrane-associated phospholipid phosphatase